MRSNRLVLILVAMGFLAAAGPMAAHHSWQVDRTKMVTVKGTVASFSLSNPHVQIQFDVKDADGNIAKWSAGGGSPSRLSRSGWNRDTLKPGDEIAVTAIAPEMAPPACNSAVWLWRMASRLAGTRIAEEKCEVLAARQAWMAMRRN